MINESVAELLTKQMNMEFQAFYKYLSISAYCESISLNGFSAWFALQSEEERGHAMKIYKYLLDQDKEIKLLPLHEPKGSYSSVEDAVHTALENEKAVTASINEIAGHAVKQGDFATYSFLQWFINEQVEEEATVRNMLDQVRLVKDSGEGLLLLDREFGVRNSSDSAAGAA